MANTKITNSKLFNLGGSTSATQLPVMTTAERIAMQNTSTGETIFNSTTDKVEYFDGTNWYGINYVSPLDPNLVLYLDAGNTNSYPGTGTTWFDLTENQNNGTIIGATWNNGGGYFDFDGSNDYVNISATANSPVDFSQKNYTISCWINPDSASSNRPIFTKYGTADSLRSIYFNIHNDGTLRLLQRGTGTFDQQFSSSAISVGVWTNVTVVRDSGTVNFYIDGALDASRPTTFTPNTGGTQNINIGSQANGSFSFFDGKISYVKLFDKVLTASEVLVLYQQGM